MNTLIAIYACAVYLMVAPAVSLMFKGTAQVRSTLENDPEQVARATLFAHLSRWVGMFWPVTVPFVWFYVLKTAIREAAIRREREAHQ